VETVTEEEPDDRAATTEIGEPEFESTLDKLNRGALPPDDRLVQLRKVIENLRAFAAGL
jgi:hypothetical protein